jgi:glutathione synthase/RimK-type ligase-like ATP-grasp enzyme
MLTILLPYGSYRGPHTNHFLSEAQEVFGNNFNVLGLDKFFEHGLPEDCTICMPRLGGVHTGFKEAMQLLKEYEDKGIIMYPNISALLDCRHKDIFYSKCQEIDVPIPDTYTINFDEEFNLDVITFEGPYICKPSVGSGGLGIVKADTKNDLLNIITLIQQKEIESEHYLDKIIIQKFIENTQDFPISTRIYVLNNKVTCSTKIVAKLEKDQNVFETDSEKTIFVNSKEIHFHNINKYNVVSNVISGGSVIPNIATEYEKEIALKVTKHLNLEFTAMDFVHDVNGNPYVLEANISPQVFKTHLLYKIHHPKMIYSFLQEEYGI